MLCPVLPVLGRLRQETLQFENWPGCILSEIPSQTRKLDMNNYLPNQGSLSSKYGAFQAMESRQHWALTYTWLLSVTERCRPSEGQLSETQSSYWVTRNPNSQWLSPRGIGLGFLGMAFGAVGSYGWG